MLYGLETYSLRSKDVQHLEQLQRPVMKRIQCPPINTATSAAYGLLGIKPIRQELDLKKLTLLGNGFLYKDTLEFETGLDLRKLTLLGNVLLHKDTLEFEIAQRQLAIKSIDSNSWFVDCNRLLYKYSLPSIYHVIGHIESPEGWRVLLKKHIDFYMSIFDLTTRVTRVAKLADS